jgi:battenin
LRTGLINNVLYVIILSAALDLVGPSIPKGVVLLFDVVPSFFVKLVAPYFIHLIPYWVRIWILVALSACGMLLIALTPGPSIGIKMFGVILASLSSGTGELSFLGLTHYYGRFSLASWGSGTGGAGLIGAGAYALATNVIGLDVRTSLFAFSFLPLIMLLSFFVILPREILSHSEAKRGEYESLSTSEPTEPPDDNIPESEDLFPASVRVSDSQALKHGPWTRFRGNLVRAKSLFVP